MNELKRLMAEYKDTGLNTATSFYAALSHLETLKMGREYQKYLNR